jgi:tetraacyldisaccharide 4'-kinase
MIDLLVVQPSRLHLRAGRPHHKLITTPFQLRLRRFSLSVTIPGPGRSAVMPVVAECAEPPAATVPVRRDGWFHELVSGQRRGLGATLLRTGLSAASVPYGLAVRTRNWLFHCGWKRVHRAAVPVVSVGNLTLGGTGKTPTVEYIARFLRRMDKRVAILSRGYGAEQGRNDEALVLEENLPDVPHLQGANRVELAQIAAEELESEALLLDDGFQHRRLHRDLDIVLIDATNPWGFNRLFPRGLLREPKSSLRRADVVIMTRCDLVSVERVNAIKNEVDRLAPGKEIVESVHAPTCLVNENEEAPLSLLNEHPVVAFCGIGNPEAFRATLAACGVAHVAAFVPFPDHHRYTRPDVDRLRTWAESLPADAIVVTTQKDLVKLRLKELSDRPLWALQIALTPTRGQDVLDRMLEGICT